MGLLNRVRDTLGRDIDIAYNADFNIESVTDFAGRQVRYEYYGAAAIGGNAGDLKSVTLPAVTGTPNGNDYPNGKTITYTYSTGFGDPGLNHNLLTITDGRRNDPNDPTFGDGRYVTNVYAATTDPFDPDYDRVTRQIWGAPDDIIDIVYVPTTPTAQNGQAVIKAIINDRNGNVKELLYDATNLLVSRRDFTGRADPSQPTTETGNRPTGPLHPGDPPFFETTWEWNVDAKPSREVYPNGNITETVYESDLVPTTPARARGNARVVTLLPGPLGGDQTSIEETFEYDTGFGSGCCGFNFVVNHIDARNNATHSDYDTEGNRIRTVHRDGGVEEWEYNSSGQMTAHILPDNGSGHRRRDEYVYYDGGPQRGYLKQIIIDGPGLALTTTYEYDLVGNVVRVIDPRGNDTQLVVNQLDQVVQKRSREVVLGTGTPVTLRYEKDYYYDANNNIARIDVQNIDDQGVLQPNTHFSTLYSYDIIDHPVAEYREVGSANLATSVTHPSAITPGDLGECIIENYDYDGNRNMTRVLYGEATNGNQPANTRTMVYDERDLLFKEIRAETDRDQSTTQYDYDGNANLLTMTVGLEETPHVYTYAYDGYDREILATDPMGNMVANGYNANHNLVSVRVEGETVDVAGGAGNILLSETTHDYDEMDRRVRTTRQFFDTETQTPIGDGQSVTQTDWSKNSQIVGVVNDNHHAASITHDTANRPAVLTDAKGNTLTYGYDDNSNVTTVTELDKSDLGKPDQVFVTTTSYDAVNGPFQIVDNVGNANRMHYDSRGNLTLEIDALANETRYEFDGADRLVRVVRDMNGNGPNAGEAEDIVTTQTWDDTSRLTSRTDDNGNKTRYDYDPPNRRISETYADQTVDVSVYDLHDTMVSTTDPNGSVSTCAYDLLDRLVRKDIAPGPGVSNDTTFETYQYDGLSRLVTGVNDDSTVGRSHDSLSNVTRETLNGQTTVSGYDGVGNLLSCVYPGGRTINCAYDELEQLEAKADQTGSIAEYHYVGASRVERRDYGNGTRVAYEYDGIDGVANPSGDFGVKRLIRTTHSRTSDGAILDDRTYKWNERHMKTQRADIRPGGPQLTHDYTYDAIYCLAQTDVTDGAGASVRNTVYSLDGVGNRISVTGEPDPGVYSMDATLPEAGDAQMNQYTDSPLGTHQYDKNGNLAVINPNSVIRKDIKYDYRNRMVEYAVAPARDAIQAYVLGITTDPTGLDVNGDGVVDVADAVAAVRSRDGQRHTYTYDALGRRIARVVDADGAPQETRYFYDGWRVREEQDASGATQATYVYGLHIDEVLNMHRGDEDYYYHTDDLYNVMAVTDSTGAVRERHEYADYGFPVDPTTLAPVGGAPSPLDNPYLFQGRRYDPETGLFYFRSRYYDPLVGRFLQRDPAWDPGNMGNQCTFVGNNPVTIMDPWGLEGQERDAGVDFFDKVVHFLYTGEWGIPPGVVGGAVAGGGSLAIHYGEKAAKKRVEKAAEKKVREKVAAKATEEAIESVRFWGRWGGRACVAIGVTIELAHSLPYIWTQYECRRDLDKLNDPEVKKMEEKKEAENQEELRLVLEARGVAQRGEIARKNNEQVERIRTNEARQRQKPGREERTKEAREQALKLLEKVMNEGKPRCRQPR